MSCNKPVHILANLAESWEIAITPQGKLHPSMLKHTENGLGSTRHFSFTPLPYFHKLHGSLEEMQRNIGKLRCHLLIRSILDMITRFPLPAIHPLPAEAAVAIEDEERFGHQGN